MCNKDQIKTKGSTVYIALLLMSIMLVISSELAGTAFNQTRFSDYSTQSQNAFYAADRGIECALYNDYKQYSSNAPAQWSAFPYAASGSQVEKSIVCENVPGGTTASLTGATSTFYIKLGPGKNDPCSYVSVGKYLDASNNIRTMIVAKGYNGSDPVPSNTKCTPYAGQRIVERTLVAQY